MIPNRDYTRICTDVTKVDNYADALNDPDEMYVLHHVLGWKYTAAELVEMNMYYHRPPEEFLFVTEDVHKQSRWIHKARRIPTHNKPHSAEAKRKISESKKGRPAHNKGKPMSAESRKKMSESKKAYYAAKRKAAEAAAEAAEL